MVDGFRKSCLANGVLHPHIEGLPDKNSWRNNTGMKPSFILNCMDRFHKWNIIYVDIDAKIRAYPVWFDTVVEDFAANTQARKELLSGTLYFANNPRVRAIVVKWVEKQERLMHVFDQKNLENVIKDDETITVAELPPAYVQIFDLMAHHGEPVIEHFQASRRFRK